MLFSRPVRASLLILVAGGACGGSLMDETGAAATNDDVDFSNPAGEVCGNGFDDNANGQVDENCTCDIGTTSQCYAGPPGAAGVGACKFGTHTCVPGDSTEVETLGMWGPCEGSVLPVTELCGDGLDSDCNGRTECDECESGGTCPPPSSGSGDYNTSATGGPGSGSGDENTSGAGASGSGSGDENTSGVGASGSGSGDENTSGVGASGSGSGDENTSGVGASGSGSGDENTSGAGAAGPGSGSGDWNTSGAGASFTGSGSGDWNTSGAGASFTGSGSGDFDTSGAGASSGSGDLNTSGAGASGSGTGDYNTSGAGAGSSTGSGGGDECICKPGTVRWCDTPIGCLWGKQVCAPDGTWGSCLETVARPAGCGDLEFYDPGCCLLASNACCQNPYTDASLGECAQQLDCN